MRLRVPITARPEQIHPWAIPGSTLAASATVRIGYWLATILSDDYRWQLVDFEASWFHAVPTDEDGLQRFTAAPPARRGRTPTSTLLAAHLATLNDAERRTLTELVTAHQRTPDRGAAPSSTLTGRGSRDERAATQQQPAYHRSCPHSCRTRQRRCARESGAPPAAATDW